MNAKMNKSKLKKIRIPIGKLFEKLNIKHTEDNYFNEYGQTHLPPIDLYIKNHKNELVKINYLVTKKSDTYEYKLENNQSLKTSDKHIILQNGIPTIIDKAKSIDNIDGNSYKIIDKKPLTKNDIVYDIAIDNPHLYITPDGSIHHNTTVAMIMFLYDIARMLCLESPQEKYNLQGSAKLVGLLVNSTIDQVYRVNYDPIIALIRNSPFFVSKLNNKNKNSLFINNIDIVVGTRKRNLVGLNAFTFIADEIARMNSIQKGLAEEIIAELINRVNSRFLLEGNKWCAIPSIISSADEEQSTINNLFKMAEEDELGIEKDKIILERSSRFVVKGDVTNYSGKIFYLFIGNMTSEPFIIETKEDEERYHKVKSSDDELKIVPIEHKPEFIDIYTGIRDVLGIPISANKTFIGSPEKIKNISVITPIVPDEIVLPNGGDLLSYFNTKQLDILKPGETRVIGMDIALSGDRFGLAMGHIHSMKEVGGEKEYEIYIDFVTGIKPKPNEKIRLDDIRKFIYQIDKMGIKIGAIIMDSYQSTDMLQLLNEKGFKAINHSVDRKKDTYYELRNMIYEEKIKIPNNKILIKELIYLKEDGKKIDHPDFFSDGTPGSKDLSDAIAQCVYGLLHEIEYNPLFDKSSIEDMKKAVNEFEEYAIANISYNTNTSLEEDIKNIDKYF